MAGLPGERNREGCGQNFSNIINELELKDLPIRGGLSMWLGF